jgi:hypothetical protein
MVTLPAPGRRPQQLCGSLLETPARANRGSGDFCRASCSHGVLFFYWPYWFVVTEEAS